MCGQAAMAEARYLPAVVGLVYDTLVPLLVLVHAGNCSPKHEPQPSQLSRGHGTSPCALYCSYMPPADVQFIGQLTLTWSLRHLGTSDLPQTSSLQAST